VSTVTVIAKPGAGSEGVLEELRASLADEGVTDPRFEEVSDIRNVPESARRAVNEGADLIFVYGGDGTVQLCIHGLAGRQAALAILPGGTGNILAGNLGIPEDIAGAVRIGLHGRRRPLDAGAANGERFAVMAGAG